MWPASLGSYHCGMQEGGGVKILSAHVTGNVSPLVSYTLLICILGGQLPRAVSMNLTFHLCSLP